MLRFAVLGGVRVWLDGRELAVGPRQRRAVLVVLLLSEGRAATLDELIDGVWGEFRTPSAVYALRNHIAQLRRLLEPDRSPRARSAVLVSLAGGGYRLCLPAGAVVDLDAVVACERGIDEVIRVSPERARDWLDRTLSLWDADLLSGVPGPFAQRARERLRLRQAALSARRARLEYVGSSDLRSPVVGSMPESPYRVALRLPPDIVDFVGREELIGAIEQRLMLRDGSGVPVVALSGMGGIGKSALATHVAHRLHGEFPDGCFHVDLRSCEAPESHIAQPLGDLLRMLGMPGGSIADTVPQRSAQLRECLDGKQILLVLDNVSHADDIAALLPNMTGSAVILTGRTILTTLPGALQLRPGVFRPDEARRLLVAVVGSQRVAAEPDAAAELAALCGFLPLAVRIAGARLAARPRWTIASVVERFGENTGVLRLLSTGDITLQEVFGPSCAQLDPRQARAFRTLATLAAADFASDTAAAALGISCAEAEQLCESLVDASLLETTAPGRYQYHALVRLFAVESARESRLFSVPPLSSAGPLRR